MANGEIEKILNEGFEGGALSAHSLENLKEWLVREEYKEFRDDLIRIIRSGDFKELNDAFDARLQFGTGGIRGKMGPGPNRINRRTIGEASQGLANYISRRGKGARERGVAIGYDTRHRSEEFARLCARILTANGIRAHLFDGFRPTPEISFAVRKLRCIAGVMISASHNPPSDNGFKVYWSDGAQMLSPEVGDLIGVMHEVREIKGLEGNGSPPLLQMLGRGMDEEYFKYMATIPFDKWRDVRLVYTPLHGAASTVIVPLMERLGFRDLVTVKEQMIPDGSFPHVANNIPNPEEPAALKMAVERAKEVRADLALATDPDGDRLGAAVPSGTGEGVGEWRFLSGNQIAILLCHYVLDSLRAAGRLTAEGVVVKTLVTSELITRLAEHYGVGIVGDLLVGFKYIARVIRELEGSGGEFIFGAEESHGYLRGTEVRDKDGAAAALLLAELSAKLKSEGKTLMGQLDEIYRNFGYFADHSSSVILTGVEGRETMDRIMREFRAAPPAIIAGRPVFRVIDRLSGAVLDPARGKKVGSMEGARGNVLVFQLSEDGCDKLTLRPSGTEPKLKYYVSCSSPPMPHLSAVEYRKEKERVDAAAGEVMEWLKSELKTRSG